MTTLERLEEIERRAAAAAPGPWERCGDVDCDGDGEFSCWHTFDRQAEILPPLGESGTVAICAQQEHDNATFIVAARTDVPALVAALRAYADECAVTYPKLAADLRAVADGKRAPLKRLEV